MYRLTRFALVAGTCVAMASAAVAQQAIPWATSAVGSAGHRALTHLASVLNREMPDYQVEVLPTPGAIVSVKGYATEEFLGYYGASIAFHELANDINRFEGFQAEMQREPVQSWWTFTTEVGVAIHERDRDRFQSWGDLSGERVFTGPLPWDVRAQLEQAFEVLGVEHEYVEVDLATAGSLLEQGGISAFIIYTNAEAATAPWITEAGLATDWIALNPSEEEIAQLHEAGLGTVEVSPEAYNRDVGVDAVVHVPFYYGFHVGLEIPEDDVYQMLIAIEENADELAELDGAFAQTAADMPEMQRRGVIASIDLVPVHPGLARYMRERGVWDSAWDERVALLQ
jgi:uncharacterized protein